MWMCDPCSGHTAHRIPVSCGTMIERERYRLESSLGKQRCEWKDRQA
jgi:hypothetical protein